MIIVNLKSLFKESLRARLNAFTALTDRFLLKDRSCCTRAFSFFNHLNNYAWVVKHSLKNELGLYRDYRKGKISTREFLDKLQNAFYFLSHLDRENKNKLLEKAWSAGIDIDVAHKNKWRNILEWSKYETIYLLGDINELDLKAIVALLKNNFPLLAEHKNLNTDLNRAGNIEIFSNLFWCLSYCNKKTTVEMLTSLVTESRAKIITVVSADKAEITRANALAAKEKAKVEIASPETFFNHAFEFSTFAMRYR